MDDREVAVASQAAKKPTNLCTREWLDDLARHLDSELELSASGQLVQSEIAILAAATIGGRRTGGTSSGIEVAADAESVQQLRCRQSAIDAPRLRASETLCADVVEQFLPGECTQRMSTVSEPAIENDQIEAIRSDSRGGESSHCDRSEESIGRRNWSGRAVGRTL